MVVLKSSALSKEYLNTGQCGVPLIICTDAPRVYKKVLDAGYQTIRVNVALSKQLLAFNQDDRPIVVEGLLSNMLNSIGPIYITDFEMLFDPRYAFDVIKLFCEKARIVSIAVKWPGIFTGSHLLYSEPGDADYHKYDCNNYQIRIVQ